MKKEFLHVRDPIFGDISIGPAEKEIIESPEFQRLRYVRQVGFSYLVYIGANHTRFEHSIGTMQITREIAGSLCADSADELAMAGLLHDIGHAPFSHTLDETFARYLKKDHEQIGRGIISRGPIREIMEKHGFSVNDILRSFDGKDEGKIITGVLGSDRIDYLTRDSHYTGVGYGVIDYERIRGKLTLFEGVPAIYAQGVPAAEAMLIARYSMWQSVYLHHASIIAGAMLRKGIAAAVESGEFDPKILPDLNDNDLLEELAGTSRASGMISFIKNRRLFKRVYYAEDEKLHPKESEIGACLSKAGIGDEDYVVASHRFKGDKEEMTVLDREGKPVGKLSTVSPLIKTLNDVLESKNIFVVAVRADLRNKAAAALKRL
jgi:hypothetical protein